MGYLAVECLLKLGKTAVLDRKCHYFDGDVMKLVSEVGAISLRLVFTSPIFCKSFSSSIALVNNN